MEAVDVQGKIYASFGRCIYCGSDGGTDGLRDEHIMPYCLGGNAIIRDASCKDPPEAIGIVLLGQLRPSPIP
jgi:hypothetical protein